MYFIKITQKNATQISSSAIATSFKNHKFYTTLLIEIQISVL